MKTKKGTGRGLALVMAFALIVGLFGGAATGQAADTATVEKAYLMYVEQFQADSADDLYYAIVTASADKTPVLLVTDSVIESSTSAAKAKVYGYKEGEICYITQMKSTGASYPLCVKGKYILSGYHHSSDRLTVDQDTGVLERISGFDTEAKKCTYKKWTVQNGKKTKVASKKISQKKAQKKEYYTDSNGNCAGTEIEFTSVNTSVN